MVEPGQTAVVHYTARLAAGPDEAFGPYRDERVVDVPRADLEARSGVEAEAGELVVTDADDAGWILDVGEDTVIVDFNHDLAAESLDVELRLLDVR